MSNTLIHSFLKGDAAALKKWWWIRLGITLAMFSFDLAMLFVLEGYWEHWILELLILYRLYELVLVHQFRKELA